jgi:hypothetical protein
LADIPDGAELDLPVSGDGGLRSGTGVDPDVVFASAMVEQAAVFAQVPFEKEAFHHSLLKSERLRNKPSISFWTPAGSGLTRSDDSAPDASNWHLLRGFDGNR